MSRLLKRGKEAKFCEVTVLNIQNNTLLSVLTG